MSDPMDFEPDWRPDSYVVPNDATEAFLMGVRGTMRRTAIAECLRHHDLEGATRLRRQPERMRGQLPPFAERDAATMAGEHLPEHAADEFDLVRIEFENREREVVCVRARARLDGWELRVVDERGRRYQLRRPWYKERLTLGQLTEFLHSVKLDSGLKGLVVGVFLEAGLRAGSFKLAYGSALMDPVHVTSPFYPQLKLGLDLMVNHYLAGREFREVRVRLGELEPDRPRVAADAAAPASGDVAAEAGTPTPIVHSGRLHRLALARRAEDLVAGGDDAAVLSFVESQESALVAIPDGVSEVALAVGVACERAGRFELAQRVYYRGLSYMPVSRTLRYWLHNNAGYSLIQLGQHRAALRPCRTAIELDPDRHNAWKNLGLALAGAGEPVEAARALLRAHHLCPRDVRALAHLEDLMTAHGDAILAAVPEVRTLMQQEPEAESGDGSAA